MFVYIAHAEADQAAADDLKAFLKSRGLVVETETGAKGFRHLQPSDVVVALWSDKQVFSSYRMAVERRMLDAWADGRLVLAKLDHSFLPVGLRDLPAIDASSANNRELAVWPEVERAAREAMNRALVGAEKSEDGEQKKQKAQDKTRVGIEWSRPPPSRSYVGGGGGGGGSMRSPGSSSGSGSRARLLPSLIILVVGLALAGSAELYSSSYPAGGPVPGILVTVALFAGAPLALAGVFGVVRWLISAAPRPSIRVQKTAAAPAGAAQSAAAPAPAAVFISYSHADDAKVGPVVKLVETSGHSVWIDKTGIHTGDGWAGEIVRAIRAAGGIVVMCSKHAFESDHIKREVYLADRYKKPMVPVFLEEARPPEDFEYFFASVQWLELFKSPQTEWPAAIGKALKAM